MKSAAARKRDEVFEGLWLDARDNAAADIPAAVRGDERENRTFVGAVREVDYHAEAALVSIDDFRRYVATKFGFATWAELDAHCAAWEATEAAR